LDVVESDPRGYFRREIETRPMPTTLALKLILTPALIGSSTLAGRRWGPALGGWLVGLPFTSGPVALFLVLDYGAAFGAQAAGGMLTGTISQVAFTLAYRRLARRGPGSPRRPAWRRSRRARCH
jgi:hypothetical protein